MIINRFRATVKRGRRSEAVEYIKQTTGYEAKRVCVSVIGDNDIVTWDVEFENIADLGPFYDELGRPETQAGMSDWWKMTKAVENEILLVVE